MTSTVDAFTFDWQRQINYWFPPPRLVGDTVDKARQDKACGYLIIPLWTGSPWFHKLTHGNKWHKSIITWSDIPPVQDSKQVSKYFSHSKCIFTDQTPTFRMVSLYLCHCGNCQKFVREKALRYYGSSHTYHHIAYAITTLEHAQCSL